MASKVEGGTAEGFERVAEEFARLLEEDDGAAGQFCGYHHGRQVVDLWGGNDVAADDLQAVFSCTKGVSGICIALLIQRGVLELDTPVSRYWPEFAGGGKADVTVRIALSHQAGIPGVEPQLTLEEMLDHEVMAARLARQVPHWRPGKTHGYHALTLGTIIDELVRRTVGVPVAEFFRQEIGDPREIDIYIRTPKNAEARVRGVLPRRLTPEQEKRFGKQRVPEPDSFYAVAAGASGGATVQELVNTRSFRESGQAAGAAVASGRGLARLYAMCIGEVDGLPRLLSDATLAEVTQIQAVGEDLVLRAPRRYGIVFQKADEQSWFGSHLAFGHGGQGGGIGIADPWHDIAYGWIPRRMSFPGGADARGLALAKIMRECLPVPR